MSDWTTSEVVELLRLQGVPKHSLEFSFKHGIDGAVMDESVDFVVRDLRLASVADEERIVKKWREISLSEAKPQDALNIKKEVAGAWQPKAIRALSQKFSLSEPAIVVENAPVRGEDTDTKPAVVEKPSSSIASGGNEETYSQDFDDASQSRSVVASSAKPSEVQPSAATSRSHSEESSILDEAPLFRQHSQFENSVQTSMQPPTETADIGAVIVKQTQEYLERRKSSEARQSVQSKGDIEAAKEAARVEAAAKYEAALQKQTELLRIQQERIRLQTLLIERQREELHTLSTPREVVVARTPSQPSQQLQQVPAARHAHWGGAEDLGDEEDEQYFYPSSAPPPVLEMPFSPPIHTVGIWGQPGNGLQDSISMLSGSEVFETASSDGNNQHTEKAAQLMYKEEMPPHALRQSSPTPPTPRNTLNLSIEGKMRFLFHARPPLH
jgi:hypothetical protein